MSVEMNRDATEGSEATDTERREAQGDRIPFEGIVEVGGAVGPSFEAQAIDLSEAGIHLRTAYLPELGQPLTCRFDLAGEVVLAGGEVVWRQEAELGGEFGLRFTDLDEASESALKKLVCAEPVFAPNGPGSRVRLHIEGLGSPMRARVKTGRESELVVGSELGFLQVGKELELEDARTGGKRQARIDRVGVEINPETNVPQLVVTLRYDSAVAGPRSPTVTADDTPEPSVIDDDHPQLAGGAAAVAVDEPFPMRSGVGELIHRASAKVGPALHRFGAHAKTTMALIAARTRRTDPPASPPRRTTAPPPAGGLHAAGRKVVRHEISAMAELEPTPSSSVAKRRLALASAAAVAIVLAFLALRRPSAGSNVAVTDPSPSAAPVLAAPATPPAPAASITLPAPANASVLAAPVDESPAADPERHTHKKPTHVTPFGNGPVGHANVLHLKMDGTIEKIEGATTPTGFTVVIPDRRSLEAAAPLAARDGRIAAVRVTNEGSGAELALSFRDGVPNYQVRARGDTLEIALAPQGKLPDLEEATKPAARHKAPHAQKR